jgi:hypothetical protein
MATLSINKVYEEILEKRNNTLILSRGQDAKLKQMIDQSGGFGPTLHAALEDVGEWLGLYDIMTQSGPITPACLATQACIPERSARIWLEALAAENYLEHEVSTNLYCLWCNWSPGQNKGPR